MKTLKDKEKYYDVRFVEDFGNEFAIPTEDVKEAVLRFEKEIESWKLNSSKSIDTTKRNILIELILKQHRKIFGDWENE